MPWKELFYGIVLTLLGLVVWLGASLFGLGPANAMIAVLAGVILGLARDRSPLARYCAYFIGLLFGILGLVFGMLGWVGWVVAIVLLTIVTTLTKGRLPLWAMILGAGTLAAIYEPAVTANPWFVLTQYPTALFVALAASSGGFLVTIIVEIIEMRRGIRVDGQLVAGPVDSSDLPGQPLATLAAGSVEADSDAGGAQS